MGLLCYYEIIIKLYTFIHTYIYIRGCSSVATTRMRKTEDIFYEEFVEGSVLRKHCPEMCCKYELIPHNTLPIRYRTFRKLGYPVLDEIEQAPVDEAIYAIRGVLLYVASMGTKYMEGSSKIVINCLKSICQRQGIVIHLRNECINVNRLRGIFYFLVFEEKRKLVTKFKRVEKCPHQRREISNDLLNTVSHNQLFGEACAKYIEVNAISISLLKCSRMPANKANSSKVQYNPVPPLAFKSFSEAY
uniref:ARAD1A05786p n=1 Tax=Blastobotrys adeninivorans TaxID=409370 RepID=A0A060SXP0_BLAAD